MCYGFDKIMMLGWLIVFGSGEEAHGAGSWRRRNGLAVTAASAVVAACRPPTDLAAVTSSRAAQQKTAIRRRLAVSTWPAEPPVRRRGVGRRHAVDVTAGLALHFLQPAPDGQVLPDALLRRSIRARARTLKFGIPQNRFYKCPKILQQSTWFVRSSIKRLESEGPIIPFRKKTFSKFNNLLKIFSWKKS